MLNIVLLLAACSWVSQAQHIQNTLSRKTLDISQRLYKEHVLWETRSKTLTECSVACTSDHSCLAFTLLKKNPPDSDFLCRGYSEQAQTLNDGKYTEVPGIVLFQVTSRHLSTTELEHHHETSEQITSSTSTSSLDEITGENSSPGSPPVSPKVEAWEGSKCGGIKHCRTISLQENVVCFMNTCLCRPGYFYSISTHLCVAECASTHLANDYRRYENRTMKTRMRANPSPTNSCRAGLSPMSANDKECQVESLQECFKYCNANTSCRSFEFQRVNARTRRSQTRRPISNCYISSTVAHDRKRSILNWSRNFDYYQRHCM